MKFVEAAKAADQPARGEGRFNRNLELARIAYRRGLAGCLGHCVEQGCQLAAKPAPCLGQLHTAPGAQKKLGAEPLLEIADVPADGGMGNEKLARRLGETFMPGGSFEGFECIQRWQAAGQIYLL